MPPSHPSTFTVTVMLAAEVTLEAHTKREALEAAQRGLARVVLPAFQDKAGAMVDHAEASYVGTIGEVRTFVP